MKAIYQKKLLCYYISNNAFSTFSLSYFLCAPLNNPMPQIDKLSLYV